MRPRVVRILPLLIAVIIAVGIGAVWLNQTTARPVLLTLFVGSATIERGGATPIAGNSGDSLGNGDAVHTSSDGKAALAYPDGSVTRLDSSTRVVVHVSQTGASVQTKIEQSAGLTWNTVKHLAGGSSFQVSGPNSTSAEVRGTRFGYYVEHDAAGNPVVWIDVYDGVVGVTGPVGPPVVETAGQRVTVRPHTAPTQPAPIPEGDLRLAFTVFNQTIEVVNGTPIAFQSGTFSSGQTSAQLNVDADGRSDLQFVLGWPQLPGSTFELTVVAPDGSTFARADGTSSPIIVAAPKAAAGTWTLTVRDVSSPQPDAWWLVAGRR